MLTASIHFAQHADAWKQTRFIIFLTPTTLPAIFGKVYQTRVASDLPTWSSAAARLPRRDRLYDGHRRRRPYDCPKPRAAHAVHLTLPHVSGASYEMSPCSANCVPELAITGRRP